MSIYIRGDATPFTLTGKSDDQGTELYGTWAGDPHTKSHATDRSRIVADGGSREVEDTIAALPVSARRKA